jgi:hypothetical protein
MNIAGKSQWDFCCEWYRVTEIEDSIARDTSVHIERRSLSPIPTDIRSREFAEWLTHQYRLAMNKGIELAERELAKAKGSTGS